MRREDQRKEEMRNEALDIEDLANMENSHESD